MAKTAGNGFVSVVIQYRLGAFGFASSQEIFQKGVPNAGIHDMHFALEWVQQNIAQFGGDPDQVTIAGESAGGGSVMLLAMANGGEDGTRLFRRAIASSPYLPTQPYVTIPPGDQDLKHVNGRLRVINIVIIMMGSRRSTTTSSPIEQAAKEPRIHGSTAYLMLVRRYSKMPARELHSGRNMGTGLSFRSRMEV